MSLLTRLFGEKAPPVTIPYSRVKDSLPAWNQSIRDDDFTDYVFRTLGIGRIHHLNAKTFCYLPDPGKEFALASGNDLENPMKFSGSEGIFVTSFQSGKKQGLGIIVRQDIPDVRYSHESRHVTAGFSGLRDPETNSFLVRRLIAGNMGPDGRVNGLTDLSVTMESVQQILDSVSISSIKMMSGGTLSARSILNSLTNTP